VGISLAGIIFVLSGASPSTAVFFRCLYALPLLWWLMRREDGAYGPRGWRVRRWALLAGIFFAGDLLLFHHAILLIGAGLATVLVNLQVVFVTLAAWVIWHERPSVPQALAIPVARPDRSSTRPSPADPPPCWRAWRQASWTSCPACPCTPGCSCWP
jgi:drug/metabolite transporter (DMT)-like permease